MVLELLGSFLFLSDVVLLSPATSKVSFGFEEQLIFLSLVGVLKSSGRLLFVTSLSHLTLKVRKCQMEIVVPSILP